MDKGTMLSSDVFRLLFERRLFDPRIKHQNRFALFSSPLRHEARWIDFSLPGRSPAGRRIDASIFPIIEIRHVAFLAVVCESDVPAPAAKA